MHRNPVKVCMRIPPQVGLCANNTMDMTAKIAMIICVFIYRAYLIYSSICMYTVHHCNSLVGHLLFGKIYSFGT